MEAAAIPAMKELWDLIEKDGNSKKSFGAVLEKLQIWLHPTQGLRPGGCMFLIGWAHRYLSDLKQALSGLVGTELVARYT